MLVSLPSRDPSKPFSIIKQARLKNTTNIYYMWQNNLRREQGKSVLSVPNSPPLRQPQWAHDEYGEGAGCQEPQGLVAGGWDVFQSSQVWGCFIPWKRLFGSFLCHGGFWKGMAASAIAGRILSVLGTGRGHPRSTPK